MKRKTRAVAAPAVIAEINTTPLIDVMLVLLVMLIITIPVQLHAVKLNLPAGTPPPTPVSPPVVAIAIDADSRVSWDGLPLDEAQLERRLQEAAAQAEPPEVHVRPDRNASYDRFAAVMVAVDRAGLRHMGVVGNEQFNDP